MCGPLNCWCLCLVFQAHPGFIDASDCHRVGERVLLYVGISPKAPPANGKSPSRSTLRKRLQTHYGGNAEGSTLRLTLGCLLSEELGVQLRRLAVAIATLSRTLASKSWIVGCKRMPSCVGLKRSSLELERRLLSSGLHLPLNIDRKRPTRFFVALSTARVAYPSRSPLPYRLCRIMQAPGKIQQRLPGSKTFAP